MFEGVGSVEDGVAEGDVDQLFNGSGVRICPQEVGPLFQEVGEWSGDVSEAQDEGSLVAQYAQCRSHLFQGIEFLWPVPQAFDLDGVDVDPFSADDDS